MGHSVVFGRIILVVVVALVVGLCHLQLQPMGVFANIKQFLLLGKVSRVRRQ
jgi:glutamate synthase domain-containing protein 2